ncbi:hypothetical protein PM082_014295 [Marasmius tenuissimus]|nr:hypothetical protein PM082_014295 [Marasmius tenuissimus]
MRDYPYPIHQKDEAPSFVNENWAGRWAVGLRYRRSYRQHPNNSVGNAGPIGAEEALNASRDCLYYSLKMVYRNQTTKADRMLFENSHTAD